MRNDQILCQPQSGNKQKEDDYGIIGSWTGERKQYFSMHLPFLQEWPNSTGIHRNPQEWDWNPQE